MAKHFNASELQQVSADLAEKAGEIRRRYGPDIGWERLQQLLRDPQITPFPCEICFDSSPLLPGEFAHSSPKGTSKDQGFIIYLHPKYASQLARVPYLVLHQLVQVTHQGLASVDDAEMFGALALGLSKDAYYRALCDLSLQINSDASEAK